MSITFIDHNDFLALPDTHHDFWIDQLIPCAGTVLIWGNTSIGKSPLSWALACSIANGTPFFYLPVKQGRVLYIELDTPQALVLRRARVLPISPNLRWGFAATLHPDTPDWHALSAQALAFQPDVVFINTLRKAHAGSDIESHVPSEVYARYQRLCPGASIVFMHHARKAKPEAGMPANENFSGSQAWQNDAQLAARLYRCKPKDEDEEGQHLALEVTKSQVSATGELMRLYLAGDGVTLTPDDYSAVIQGILDNPGASRKELANLLGCGEATVGRARRKLKNMSIPHSSEVEKC